jgi:hypothetical protein
VRVVLTVLLLALLVGCGEDGQSTSDCALAVRSEGTVYVEAGFVSGPAQPWGKADFASCDDNGEDASGVYFGAHARQVDVWTFKGHEPKTVLGVRVSDNRFRVFVAEGEDPIAALDLVRQSQSNLQR